MQRNFFFLLLSICSCLCFTQSKKKFHIPDSLKTKDFQLLEESFNKTLRVDKKKAEVYANTFLIKAKENKNLSRTSNGYLMLHRSINDNTSLLYLDSMMVIAKKINRSDYLSDGYMYKGNYYYLKGKFSESLTNYLTARDYAENDSETYHILNFNIGLLKLELEQYQQAIQLFLSYKQYLEKNNLTNKMAYQSCIYALAYAYSKINQLNSSDEYVKIGLEKNNEVDFAEIKSSLLLVSGINAYKRQNYKKALRDLNNVSKLIKDNSYNPQNLAISQYYIGKILYQTNDNNFLDKFKTVDSIVISTKSLTSELRDAYPILIDYFKKNGDKEKQLFYIEHLLTVDSILNKNNLFLSAEIHKNYDTPNLLKEKESLISDLNSRSYTLLGIIIVSGLIIICLLYLYIENRKKVKSYRRKADLLTQVPAISTINEISDPVIIDVEIPKEKTKAILSDDKLKQLSIQLEAFENENRFLDKKINLDILSKELNTNRVYLSKSVNELKGQNFPQYLNQLRIEYIVNNLKENKILRKHTIAAIADEAGYNNAESFTNAFKKITGTLPSYFIKALQESTNK
ncbi:hypothetical protein IQ37_04705 [Chryseobacterium piperi]|uniref:HTH araC/xylS-type domain-containing protein n=1 Tax=Chryseobacterium piperi TaxID=558152 RepID=A0A086BKR7_9FLAO|nr:AraC family transcriptional regulator [Chryseobacterium piperi]ASW74369.1 AraC family transcriptional regulator [Chryseobacterium piperi]KFF29531.1 hypothetical protein IQ37_04705 [Chryseobacterium piperi]